MQFDPLSADFFDDPYETYRESRIAFEELRVRWPRFEVDDSGLRRVQMSNVAGFSHVPVARAA